MPLNWETLLCVGDSITLGEPTSTIAGFKYCFERIVHTFVNQVPFHVRDMRCIAGIAQSLI